MSHKLTLALALLAAGAAPAPAQNAWTWHKAVPAGQVVEIKGIIGNIVATAASGSEVEVVARKTADRGDTANVRIQAVEQNDGVTICVIYYADDDCDGNGHSGSHDNDTHVDFEVHVPRGVRFSGRTVVGRIEATGLSADVDAATVTGDVRVSTTGLVDASSVSGSLRLQLGRADWAGTLSFQTVSGDVTLELPGDLNSEVSFNTVSGEFASDWPVTVTTSGSRRVSGTIGSGGRRLHVSTVSGDLELRKQP
ncbi:MAG TPA: DUF4097 family beta strand repeat-containing protein [Longimicrobiales bacterium]